MANEVRRSFENAAAFYRSRLRLISLFSIPFIAAFLIPLLVPAPTYLALGGLFLRTGSFPEFGILELLVTVAGYAIALFLIADTVVNINIVVRSKRTLTQIKSEVVSALGTYASKIFYIYTLMVLLLIIVQLLTFDNPLQPIIYPLFSLLLSYLLFFVAPAVVIDGAGTAEAISRSASMAISKPMMFLSWSVSAFILLAAGRLILDMVLPSPYSGIATLILNSLILFPFLIVLQTQMYMEKYPLAR